MSLKPLSIRIDDELTSPHSPFNSSDPFSENKEKIKGEKSNHTENEKNTELIIDTEQSRTLLIQEQTGDERQGDMLQLPGTVPDGIIQSGECRSGLQSPMANSLMVPEQVKRKPSILKSPNSLLTPPLSKGHGRHLSFADESNGHSLTQVKHVEKVLYELPDEVPIVQDKEEVECCLIS